jgi:hypothetical protein
MTGTEDILKLQRDYIRRSMTDPVFHARVRLISNVLIELQKMGRLDPDEDNGYAGYIVAAALEEHLPPAPQSEAWARGVADGQLHLMNRKPLTDPYQKEDTHHEQ